MLYDVLIVGGGASGLMAASALALRGRRVVLLEKQARVGRKLLSTGNGRCNLTNEGMMPENYHSETPEFVRPALAAFPVEKTLKWFHALGLLTVTEPSGRVYPLSDSANSVLDVLRFAIEGKENITLLTGQPVLGVTRVSGGFRVETEQETYDCENVIVACGGMAGAKIGGVKDGYTLLQCLGHSRTALHPALVQLTTETEYPKALKGVRADAHLTLAAKRTVLARTEGEVQFTEKGVSGPAVFDLSRAASTGGEGLTLTLDFLRDYPIREVYDRLCARRKAAPKLTAADLLTGMLHNRLGRTMIRYVNQKADTPLSELSDAALKEIARACKGFQLPVRGTEGFDSAQVTAGGIRCTEFDARTMESRIVPGLFACGEVLDVDGDCGGFNLQWAWSSGHLAGRLGK